MIEKSSYTNSNADEQQIPAIATRRKFKVVEEDSNFFYDDSDKAKICFCTYLYH